MRAPLRLLLLLFAVCLSQLGSQCQQSPQDWFLLVGQSNMVGASSQATPVAPGRSMRAIDRLWASPLEDPEVHGIGGEARGSAWPAFAAAQPQPVGLIAAGLSATCLLDWPAVEGRWKPGVGDLYGRAVGAWLSAGSPPIKAALWYQGECDAQQAKNEGLPAATIYALYKQALFELADAVARDFAAPLVVAPISLRWCRWDNPGCNPALFYPSATKMVPIHDAAVDAAAEHPSILLGPSSDDLRLMDDTTHVWDVNELGLRWAAAVAGL